MTEMQTNKTRMTMNRVLGFYAPTKMFYDLWVNRGNQPIDEHDREHPHVDNLIANQRDPQKRAVLEAELARYGLQLDQMNERHEWSLKRIP